MLQNLIHIFFVSVACYIWSVPLYLISPGAFVQRHIKLEILILQLFSGLCLLSVFSSWLVVIFPLRIWFLPVFTILLFCSEMFYLKTKHLKLPKISLPKFTLPEILFFTICVVLFLFLSASEPALQDEYLYHVQCIRWAEEHGTVPGLANLYLRYGFYSNWFHLLSLFRFPFLNNNYSFLNCTVSVWFLIYLLQGIRTSLQSFKQFHQYKSLYYFSLLLYMLYEWRLVRIPCSR